MDADRLQEAQRSGSHHVRGVVGVKTDVRDELRSGVCRAGSLVHWGHAVHRDRAAQRDGGTVTAFALHIHPASCIQLGSTEAGRIKLSAQPPGPRRT